VITENQTSLWWVYIVECADGSLYTGTTDDVEKRIDRHNTGKGAKYTRSRGPVRLVHREQHPSRSHALKREIEIKKLRRAQKKLIVDHSLKSV
jgi:predicted GIY-YIG superfamily endonuclease